jgi:hypothetical protein
MREQCDVGRMMGPERLSELHGVSEPPGG